MNENENNYSKTRHNLYVNANIVYFLASIPFDAFYFHSQYLKKIHNANVRILKYLSNPLFLA